MGYSFRLTARVLLYAPSHRQAFVKPVVEHWLVQEIAQTKVSGGASLKSTGIQEPGGHSTKRS